eukprot:6195859-Pleurochrysis_carterae.AAC.2
MHWMVRLQVSLHQKTGQLERVENSLSHGSFLQHQVAKCRWLQAYDFRQCMLRACCAVVDDSLHGNKHVTAHAFRAR